MPESLEETLAKLKASPAPAPPVPNDFLVKEPEGKPLTTGMENKIEEAKNFNAELNVIKPPKTPVESEPVARTKRELIADVLKNKGMDTQQQSQALAQILEILDKDWDADAVGKEKKEKK